MYPYVELPCLSANSFKSFISLDTCSKRGEYVIEVTVDIKKNSGLNYHKFGLKNKNKNHLMDKSI